MFNKLMSIILIVSLQFILLKVIVLRKDIILTVILAWTGR